MNPGPSRVLIAAVVARHWARAMMSWQGPRGPGSLQIDSRVAAHPLSCVREALSGTTDPRELAVEEGPDADLIRRIAARYAA